MSRSIKTAGLLLLTLSALAGCISTAQIRVANDSNFDFTEVEIAGESYGDIEAGATSAYRTVRLRSRYAVLYLTAGGYRVNAQTLNFGSKKFTYRVEVKNLEAGHLAVELVKD